MCRPAGWSVNVHIQSLPIPVCCPHFLKDVTHCSCTQESKVTELNDYRPVALTSVIMKCFERLVKDHITSTLPVTLDPLQFAYHPNMSTDDAITITLHTALSHLEKRNTYVRMLFIDYSSGFNTIVPSKLIIKWFERLVKDHITSTLPDTLDPLQFAYRPNKSTSDAIAIALHTALSHLDKRCMRHRAHIYFVPQNKHDHNTQVEISKQTPIILY